MGDEKIILVHETPYESWKRDAGSLLTAFACILPGYLMGSDALQWIGVCVFVVATIASVRRLVLGDHLTFEEARDKIDAMIEARKSGKEE